MNVFEKKMDIVLNQGSQRSMPRSCWKMLRLSIGFLLVSLCNRRTDLISMPVMRCTILLWIVAFDNIHFLSARSIFWEIILRRWRKLARIVSFSEDFGGLIGETRRAILIIPWFQLISKSGTLIAATRRRLSLKGKVILKRRNQVMFQTTIVS